MTVLYSDTHPKMEALQIQLWRQATPTRKMEMLAQLNASARTLAGRRALRLSRLCSMFWSIGVSELRVKSSFFAFCMLFFTWLGEK